MQSSQAASPILSTKYTALKPGGKAFTGTRCPTNDMRAKLVLMECARKADLVLRLIPKTRERLRK